MELLGQLMMMGIEGKELSLDEKKFIETNDIGGVILFSRNYESPTQLSELTNSIQSLRKKYPLFISVDQEGGRVQRFKEGFTHFPSMMSISSLNSPKICFEVHKIMGDELKCCGVNLNLSPVCDILINEKNDVIGDRAFGTDEEAVSKFVSSAVRGLEKSGILSCAKHFPGHGRSFEDSHFHKVIVDADLEDLKNNDFLPFVRAIKARIDFLMISHIIVPSLDSDFPCSLSKKVQSYIRKEMRYSRIIISDDMDMKAITDHYSREDAAFHALKAETDILIYRDFQTSIEGFEAIKSIYKNKKIHLPHWNEKFKRIQDCKRKKLKDYEPIKLNNLLNNMNLEEHLIYRNEIISKINT